MRYCQGYGGILLRKRGYSLKVAVKQHAGRAPLKEIEKFQRNIRRRIKRYQEKGIHVLVQDKAIFVSDASPGRVYTPLGIRAVCHVSGTHDRTIVYRVLGLDGEEFFRQYDKFNGDTFAEFIKEVKREFGKTLMVADSAPQHRAKIVGKTRRRITGIRLAFLPAASPELSAVEECRRQSKKYLLRVSYVTMSRLRQTIDEYFANKTFGVDILKYLLRSLLGDTAPPKCARIGEAAPDISVEWEMRDALETPWQNRPRTRPARRGDAVPRHILPRISYHSVRLGGCTVILEH